MNIYKITIYGRGKFRDEYGNPYRAFIAIIQLHGSAVRVTVSHSMDIGSSDPDSVLGFALDQINKTLGLNLQKTDERITYHYALVYRDSALENPTRWNIN